ncbi:MAG: hypothetical protein K1X57_07140, partial [Gemmataceae bacterium]|nr:hypothetical protein [Gemmataceae bacterium]
VARCGAFGCEELEADEVELGRTATHLVVRSGAWSVWLAIDTVGRFPPYADVIPRPYQMKSSCELHPADVEFALKSLPKLPGRDDECPSVTLDLNAGVVLRAKGESSQEITELALTRSRVSGTPVRVCLRRDHLTNALRRGLRNISMADADRPVVCRNGPRTFLMMPNSSSQCVEAGANTTRIDSAMQSTNPARGRPRRISDTPATPRLPELTALLDFARDAGDRINQLIAAIEQHAPSPRPAARRAVAA